MKRFLQRATLFGAVTLSGTLFLGQQALAQDNPFYIQRFSRDEIARYIPYKDNKEQWLRANFNYSPETRINLNQDPGNVRELEKFFRHAPLLGTFLDAGNEPFQFKGLSFNFGSSNKRNYYQGQFPRSLANLTGNPLTTIPIARKRTSAGNRAVRGFIRLMRR